MLFHFAFYFAHHAFYVAFGFAYHRFHSRRNGGTFGVTADGAVVTTGVVIVIPVGAAVVLGGVIGTASGK